MKIVIIYNAKRERKRLNLPLRSLNISMTMGQKLCLVRISQGSPSMTFEGVDFSSCDAGIVLGGDGTLLAAVRALSVFDIPLFGVNMGRVGFLSSTEADDALAAVDKLLAGQYIIRERF